MTLRKITTQFTLDSKGFVTGAKDIVSKTKSITYSSKEAAAAYESAFGDMDQSVKMTSQELEAHLVKIKKIEREANKNANAYNRVTSALKHQAHMLTLTNDQQDVYLALQKLGANATEAQKVEVEELVMAQQRLAANTKAANKITERQVATSKKATANFEQLASEYKHLTARTGQSAERQERMNALQRLGAGATLTQRKEILKLVQAQQAQVMASDKSAKSMRGMRGQAQNIGWQLQDISVQYQMLGMNAQSTMLIMGQQGSQLASGFGATGALIGAGIAVGSAALGVLMKTMGGTGEQAKALKEEMNSLTASIVKLNDVGQGKGLDQQIRVSAATTYLKDLNKELKKAKKNIAAAQATANQKSKIVSSPIAGAGVITTKVPKDKEQIEREAQAVRLLTKAYNEKNAQVKAQEDVVAGANDQNTEANLTVKKLIESLSSEIGMYGKSAEAIKIRKLEMAGASKQAIQDLRILYSIKTQLQEDAKREEKIAKQQKEDAEEKIEAEKKAVEAKKRAKKATDEYLESLRVELHLLGLSGKEANLYKNAQEAMASGSAVKALALLNEIDKQKDKIAADKIALDQEKKNIKINTDLVASFVDRTNAMGKTESQILTLKRATELEGFAARDATEEQKKLTAAYYDKAIAAAKAREEAQTSADKQAAIDKASSDASRAKSDEEARLNKIAKYDPNVKLQLLTEQYQQERTLLEGNVIALQNIDEQYTNDRIKISGTYWEQYALAAKENLGSFDDQVANSLDRFSAGFGDAVGNAIFESDNLGDALGDVFKASAKNMIAFYAEMAIQRGIAWVLDKEISIEKDGLVAKETAVAVAGETTKTGAVVAAATAERLALLPLRLAGATSTTLNAQAMAVQGSLAAFAATSAIPMIGPALAPAAAATAYAAGQAMATTVGNIAFAGAYDKGGLIPSGSAGIVAEYGDELVGGTMVYNGTPSSLAVTGREDTARMTSNSNKNTFNINSYGAASPEAIARATARALKKGSKALDNAVYDSANRGRKNGGKRYA